MEISRGRGEKRGWGVKGILGRSVKHKRGSKALTGHGLSVKNKKKKGMQKPRKPAKNGRLTTPVARISK